MHSVRFFIFSCIIGLTLLAGVAEAGEVRVFKPMEKDVTTMELRQQAMDEGFAQAVYDAATQMLPREMGEVRAELFKQYLQKRAQPFIQGYTVLSTQAQQAGIILNMDVQVNKGTLRAGLKRMGIMSTIEQAQPASVVWPSTLDGESIAMIQGLMTLTGIQQTPNALPMISIEAGPEKTFKAHLHFNNREWVSINKDLSVVWFDLWSHYFMRSEVTESRTNVQKISVSGWFSPDAALEFDRVLRSWDSAVQDVRLIELDMQPSGVGASWEYRLLNNERLQSLLKSFLPQRGLSYQVSLDGQ